MDFERFTLSNGIPVVVAPFGRHAPVAVQAWFSCGTRADGKDGLSHFNEHMFFRGGRDFPDVMAVERELRLLGGMNNAVTSAEFVFYYITASPIYFRRAAHLLSDMLAFGKMETEEVEKERGAIIQELKNLLDSPEQLSERNFANLLFGDHPLGRSGLGTEDAIRSFTVADILGFKERFYGFPNAVLVVAGGINRDEAIETLEEYFGFIPAKRRVEYQPFCPPLHPAGARLMTRKGIEQAHLHIGGFTPSQNSPDIRAVELLFEILSNRLLLKIRCEQSFAYNIFAAPTFYSDCGSFMIYAGIDPEERVITAVIESVFSEIADMKSGNISEEEVDESKIALHGRIDLSLESVAMSALFLGSHELQFGRAKTLAEMHAEIDRASKSDIGRMAEMLWREESLSSLLMARRFPRFEKKYCELRKVLR